MNKVKKSFTGCPGDFPFYNACDRKQFFKVGPMAILGCLPKLKRGMGISFSDIFSA